jgi:hypothetical protein
MIRFINPLALWGLVAVAAPIVIHLLRRQRARRIQFPSLQFIQPQRTAAVRLRTPDDPWLMLLRIAIVAAAVFALAQPVVITSGRLAAWDERISRAIVIDQSRATAADTEEIAELVRRAHQGAFRATEIRAASLGLAIAQAADELRVGQPSRREIVIISPLKHGSLSNDDMAVVPRHIGVRFLPVGKSQPSAAFDAPPLLGPDGGLIQRRVTIEGFRTSVTTTPGSNTAAGIRVIGASDDAMRRVLRVVANAGTPAPDPAQPLAFAFAGAPPPQHISRLPQSWMLPVVMSMQRDSSVVDASRAVEAAGGLVMKDALIVARDSKGQPLIVAAAAGDELLIGVAAPADALISSVAVRSALIARAEAYPWHQHETEPIDHFTLSAWVRPAAPADQDAWRSAAPGDTRWCWAAALALLLAETAWRRKRSNAAAVQEAHAA